MHYAVCKIIKSLILLTVMIPTIPSSCSFEKEGRGWRDGKQEGAVRGGECDEEEEEEGKEEEAERSQKKEQLTVIIVMFNQTPAIKLINTLFPV